MKSNLKVELYRANIVQKDIAERLNIGVQAVNSKLNGKSTISTDEAFILQDMIKEKTGKELPLKYLFRT